MSEQIRMLLVLGMSIIVMFITINTTTYASQSKFIKEDLEIALHDASLQVYEEDLADGYVVFNKNKAKKIFKDTLERNTGLKEGADYDIIDWVVYDHKTKPTGFACENSKNPIYDFVSNKVDASFTISCPSILAIIKHTSENYIYLAGESKSGKDIIKGAAYTYEFNPEAKQVKGMPLPPRSIADNIPAEDLIKKGDYYWPVPFTTNITSHFQKNRPNPVNGVVANHNGTDIAINGIFNKPAVAMIDGTVTYAGSAGGYGNLVEIKHDNGLITRYGHLNSISVQRKQQIAGGDVVGLIGSTGNSTGPHLHFETLVQGSHVNPMEFYN